MPWLAHLDRSPWREQHSAAAAETEAVRRYSGQFHARSNESRSAAAGTYHELMKLYSFWWRSLATKDGGR